MKNINKITTFNLTKIAAVTLSALLIFGCDDVTPNAVSTSTDSSTDSSTDVSKSDLGQYAIITNMEAGSSGQMRYPVAAITGSELTKGQVNASVFYSSSETETAYLTLFNVDGNTSGSVGEIQLDSGKIKVRTGGVSTSSDVTFTTGEWINVNITWDIDAGTFTASVGGQSIGTFPLNNSAATGVDSIGFKIGNNDLTSSQEFLVDDFEIYSDVAGTTSVFTDDYESYVFEELLDGAGDPYKSETQPAIVGGEAVSDETTTDETVTEEGNSETDSTSTKVVSIQDTLGGTTDNSGDTGELRYKLGSTIATGQVNVSLLYDAKETQSAYVTVYSDGGTSNSNQIADLKLDEGKITLRNVDGTLANFTAGEWIDVQLNWTINGDQSADVTFSIDGTATGTTYTIPYTSSTDAGAEVVSIRYIDNDNITAYTLYADDLTIYNQSTKILSDDFEDYELGTVLDGNEDDYNNNSSEATVVAQPE